MSKLSPVLWTEGECWTTHLHYSKYISNLLPNKLCLFSFNLTLWFAFNLMSFSNALLVVADNMIKILFVHDAIIHFIWCLNFQLPIQYYCIYLKLLFMYLNIITAEGYILEPTSQSYSPPQHHSKLHSHWIIFKWEQSRCVMSVPKQRSWLEYYLFNIYFTQKAQYIHNT